MRSKHGQHGQNDSECGLNVVNEVLTWFKHASGESEHDRLI